MKAKKQRKDAFTLVHTQAVFQAIIPRCIMTVLAAHCENWNRLFGEELVAQVQEVLYTNKFYSLL